MKDFKKLKVWHKGFEIVLKTYKVTQQIPDAEKYGFVSQMNRASVSIPSNIAEGSSRSSMKEYKRFLEIALGSTFELETQLLLVKELNLCSEMPINELLLMLVEEQKMLSKLISVIHKN